MNFIQKTTYTFRCYIPVDGMYYEDGRFLVRGLIKIETNQCLIFVDLTAYESVYAVCAHIP